MADILQTIIIFKRILLDEQFITLLHISLRFVPDFQFTVSQQ